MLVRRIYWTMLIFAILLGIYFYGVAPENFGKDFLVVFILLPFLMFAGGVHGLIAHLAPPSLKGKGKSLFYPLIMGILFALMFIIYIFVVIPLVCPDILNVFK